MIGLSAEQYIKYGVADMRGQLARTGLNKRGPDTDAQKRRLIEILDLETGLPRKNRDSRNRKSITTAM
jgi:hypothetical protein